MPEGMRAISAIFEKRTSSTLHGVKKIPTWTASPAATLTR
jgi:hypothetical protein